MTYVYILRSVEWPRQTYIGVTNHLSQRLDYHNFGRCPHTSKFFPWEIVYAEMFEDRESAFRRERQIKRWSRWKKEALIAGDKDTLKMLSKRRGY